MEFRYAQDRFLRIQEDSGLNRPVVLVNTQKETFLGQFYGIVESDNAYVEIFTAVDIRRIEIDDIQNIKYVAANLLLVALNNAGIAARTILKCIEDIA